MMVPVRREVVARTLVFEPGSHLTVAIRHAATHDRPNLWGDRPDWPKTVVWFRDVEGTTREAFAWGRHERAVDWLAARAGGRQLALLAPPEWERTLRARFAQAEGRVVETWSRPRTSPLPATPARVRRLTLDDKAAFEAAAPDWALRSWGEFSTLVHRGAAFGVPTGEGFASLAWTFESDPHHDKIGVATVERFRRLGLARAAASSLVDHSVERRGRSPLWVAHPGNAASLALARSLGFERLAVETLLLLG